MRSAVISLAALQLFGSGATAQPTTAPVALSSFHGEVQADTPGETQRVAEISVAGVAQSRRARVLTGAAIGLGIGAAGGTVIGVAGRCSRFRDPTTRLLQFSSRRGRDRWYSWSGGSHDNRSRRRCVVA